MSCVFYICHQCERTQTAVRQGGSQKIPKDSPKQLPTCVFSDPGWPLSKVRNGQPSYFKRAKIYSGDKLKIAFVKVSEEESVRQQQRAMVRGPRTTKSQSLSRAEELAALGA